MDFDILVLAVDPLELKAGPRGTSVQLPLGVPGSGFPPDDGPMERGCSPRPSPHLTPQLPLSSSHLNVYSGDPQVTASLVGVTSSSCPADLTQKRELTGTTSLSHGAPHSQVLPFLLPPSQLLSPSPPTSRR